MKKQQLKSKRTPPYTRQQIWQLKNKINYTLNKDLAYAMAKKSGKAPIDYISPRHRETYLRAYPEMGQRVKE